MKGIKRNSQRKDDVFYREAAKAEQFKRMVRNFRRKTEILEIEQKSKIKNNGAKENELSVFVEYIVLGNAKKQPGLVIQHDRQNHQNGEFWLAP